MATYYIDYNASDDSGAATKGDPWKRCPGMVGFGGSYSHSAGDVFVFKGGVTWPSAALPLTVGYSGTSGNEDEYTVDETWYTGGSYSEPIFDGEETDTNCIYASGKDYVKINGLQIKDAKALTGWQESCLYTYGCDNWAVSECTFYFPVSRAFYVEEGNDWVLEKCYFDTTAVDNSYQTDCIFLWGGGGHVIQDNYATMKKDGFYIDGIQTYQVDNVTIRRNQLRHEDGYASDEGSMLIQIERGTGTFYIHHNILYNGTDNNFSAFVWDSNGQLYCYNNTIVNLGGSKGFCIDQLSGHTSMVIKNNLLYTNGGKCLYLNDSITTSNIDFNLLYQNSGSYVAWRGSSRTWSAWQGLGYDANGVNADPSFTTDYTDLTLQSDSPAIDAGVDLGSIYDDGLDPDSSWPDSVVTLDQDSYGDGWEIGAFVYESVTIDAPAFSTITATGAANSKQIDFKDTLTIAFSKNTNQVTAATKADIDSLFTFSEDLGDDYTGAWSDAATLVITVADPRNNENPQTGSFQVTAKAGNGIKDETDSSDELSGISPTLSGGWRGLVGAGFAML